MRKTSSTYKLLGLLAATAAAAGLLAGCASPSKAASSQPDSVASAPQSTADSAQAEYHKLTAEQAKARLDSGDELILLDVRTAEEYAEKHIPGAVLLPNEEIGSEDPAALPEKDAEILIYCRSGNRSAQAAKKLVALGYTNVYDFGGIKDWPYETEAGAYES